MCKISFPHLESACMKNFFSYLESTGKKLSNQNDGQ